MQALRRVQIDPYLRAPATDESDFIEEGGLDDLSQGLNHILHINVANQQPQPEATLQLLDPVMHILWLQQVKSVCSMTDTDSQAMREECPFDRKAA